MEPKFSKIGDYWDDATVDKIAELLQEYQDLFPTNFSDLKGIIGDLGDENNVETRQKASEVEAISP